MPEARSYPPPGFKSLWRRAVGIVVALGLVAAIVRNPTQAVGAQTSGTPGPPIREVGPQETQPDEIETAFRNHNFLRTIDLV